MYAVDYRKWTALHYASYNGKEQVVRLLCKYDDDENKLRNMKNSQGRTPKEIVAKDSVKLYFDSKMWSSSSLGCFQVRKT
jgi:ankyrin repeat protein